MMRKFFFLVTYGLKKKLKSKSFIIVNIVLFVLLVGIVNIDNIINFFGGDFDKEVEIYVVDNTNNFFDIFKNNYDNVNNLFLNDSDINISLRNEKVDELKDDIESNIIVEFNNDDNNYVKATIISSGYIDSATYQVLVQSINNAKYEFAVNKNNIDVNLLTKLSQPVDLERVILDEGKNSEEENMNIIMSVVFPSVILPFFMLIILLVQLIGGEINEEKNTRSMEVIISNVSSKVHLYSKILSNNLFVIIESILIFSYGAIGFFVRSLLSTGESSGLAEQFGDIFESLKATGVMDKLYYIIPFAIILMILSFVAYSLFAAILASMSVNIEDYQQVQTPIMIICLLGYYLSIMAGMFEGSIFIKIFSYVPLISCLLAPSLLAIGQIGVIDILISIGIMIGFIFVLTKYGVKIYKVGILNYSTDKIWKKIFKAARE